MECPDLRKAHSYLSQGTRPSTKNTKSTLVKRYLQNIMISNDGLLVRRETTPFLPTRELIVVPQQLIKGLLTSIHIQFNQPPASQTKIILTKFLCSESSRKYYKHHQCMFHMSITQDYTCRTPPTTPPTTPPSHPCTVYIYIYIYIYIFLCRSPLTRLQKPLLCKWLLFTPGRHCRGRSHY